MKRYLAKTLVRVADRLDQLSYLFRSDTLRECADSLTKERVQRMREEAQKQGHYLDVFEGPEGSIREDFQVLHEEALETLIGCTFDLVTSENQELYFQGCQGSPSFTFYPESADFSFELEVNGSLEDLVGEPLIHASLSESGRYQFVTKKGLVAARFVITLASAELYRLEKLPPAPTSKWFRVYFDYMNKAGVWRRNCNKDLRLEGEDCELTEDAAKRDFLAQYPDTHVLRAVAL